MKQPPCPVRKTPEMVAWSLAYADKVLSSVQRTVPHEHLKGFYQARAELQERSRRAAMKADSVGE